jgi:hemerythrin
VNSEHEVQIRLLEELEAALRSRPDRPRVSALLHQVVEYANVHFLSEELLMRLQSYPGYDAHVGEHARLMEEIRGLEREVEHGHREASADLAAAVRDWIVTHIQTEDGLFESWLEGTSAVPDAARPAGPRVPA